MKRFLSITLVLSISCAMAGGYTDAEQLPMNYRHSFTQKENVPHIDMTQLHHHQDVPNDRLSQWNPENLRQSGFMTLIGVNFLNFSQRGFAQQYGHKYKCNSSDSYDETPDSHYFLSGFWDAVWLSGSLVNVEKYPACGTYGLVLDIPPQLILKTFQLDSTTLTHGDVINRYTTTAELTENAKNFLSYEGYYNSRMVSTYDEKGMLMPHAERIYAPGETKDSPTFMTPGEMITRGRPNEHNELKFIPKAYYGGATYSVKITGFWYQDEDRPGGMFVRQKLDDATLRQLKTIANDLELPLLPLSQKHS